MTRSINYNSENSIILARHDEGGKTHALLYHRSMKGAQFAVCRSFDETRYDGLLGYERWDYLWESALFFKDVVEAVDCWKREILGGEMPSGQEPLQVVSDHLSEDPYFKILVDMLIEQNGITIRTDKVAEYLHCHPSHVRSMCQKGELPAFRVGGRWFISSVKFAEQLFGYGSGKDKPAQGE